MMSFEAFQQRKALLSRLYEEVMASPLLPISVQDKTIDQLSLAEDRARLEAERFVVSICGQVKVGKSTFINELIFGDEILPSADTVETAKLTELSFAEEPGYEILLYTPDEWASFKTSVDGKPSYYEAHLKPSIDAYIARTNDLIYPEAMLAPGMMRGDDLRDLRQFISAKGRLTPFVKSVRVFYPAEILKDVTFVDTPGTNDPNPLRSAVTLNWIGRSDAVIFLMYASQALSRQDHEFINHYLYSVPSERILLALSKIDTTDDPSRPQAYVEKALAHLEGFASTIRHKQVYPIAPIFALYPRLERRFKAGELALDREKLERINYQLYEREDMTALIQAEGHMPDFRRAIDQHLLEGKGNAILSSHTHNLRSVYVHAAEHLKNELGHVQRAIEACELSEEDLRGRAETIRSARRKLDALRDAVDVKKQNLLTDFRKAVRTAVIQMSNRLVERASVRIQGTPLNTLKTNLAWDLKSLFETYANQEFKEAIEAQYRRSRETMGEVRDEIREAAINLKLLDAGFLSRIFSDFDVVDLLDEAGRAIEQQFTADFLEQQRTKWFFFWDHKEEIESRVTGEIKRFFATGGAWASVVESYTCDLVRREAETDISVVVSKLEEAVSRIKRDNDELLASLESKAEHRQSLEAEARRQKAELADVEAEAARLERTLEKGTMPDPAQV